MDTLVQRIHLEHWRPMSHAGPSEGIHIFHRQIVQMAEREQRGELDTILRQHKRYPERLVTVPASRRVRSCIEFKSLNELQRKLRTRNHVVKITNFLG